MTEGAPIVELRLNVPDHPYDPTVSWWLQVGDRLMPLEPRQAAFLLSRGGKLVFVKNDDAGEVRVEIGRSKA